MATQPKTTPAAKTDPKAGNPFKDDDPKAAQQGDADDAPLTDPEVGSPNHPAEPPVTAGSVAAAKTGRPSTSEAYAGGHPAAAAVLHPSAVAATAKLTYDVPDSRWKMIVALVEEREGYERREKGARGDAQDIMRSRIADVDESLANFGTSYAEARQQIDERANRVAQGLPADPNAPSEHQKMIDALYEERAGYVRRSRGKGPDAAGMASRIAAVDNSLRNLGTSYEQVARARGDEIDDQPEDQADQGTRRGAQVTAGK